MSAVAKIQARKLSKIFGDPPRAVHALDAIDLEVFDKKDKDSQSRLADLGQRLNVALAQRVQEIGRAHV